MTKIIDKVNSPQDVKQLTLDELNQLASDIRKLLVNKVSQVGGHFGPNLGVVELTIALHKVFESPLDKLIWDVSHQSYPHKILTGRKKGFEEGHFHDITPYTDQEESEHDFFTIGHTSTSIALAEGMAKARDLKHEKGNMIAIIGDGSLSGGLAFEALNNAGELDSNLIVIVNDNQMSIAENHGGLYPHLAQLRDSKGQAENNIFKAFGFDYRYIDDGHDLSSLIKTLSEVKDYAKPILVHVCTEKGHGVEYSLEDKEKNHWRLPFDPKTGEDMKLPSTLDRFEDIIYDFMENEIKQGKPSLAINAAIPGVFALKKFAAKYPSHYYDAGIAEQFTIAFAAGMAANQARPYVFHLTTFAQRAYDQFLHDLAINHLPAIIFLKGGTITSSDRTHQGTMEIPMIASIPNLIYLAPESAGDLKAMLEFAANQTKNPVVIKLPATVNMTDNKQITDFSRPQYDVVEKGNTVAILGLGEMMGLARKVAASLKERGLTPTVVNPLFVSDLDEKSLSNLAKNHDLLVTLEDGSVDGGFGQRVAAYLGEEDIKVVVRGAKREFTEVVPKAELYERYRLTVEQVLEDIINHLD